jgi:nucleoside-diphosphate-sugar epimerase
VRILLTGGSSFTGAWFAQALAARGHDVLCALRGPASSGDALRRYRLALLGACEVAELAPFGTEAFLALLEERGPFDLLALHGWAGGDHRRVDLPVDAAVAATTFRLASVLDLLRRAGGSVVLLTGSVFESGEGSADPESPALTRYGLAKTLIREQVRHAVAEAGLRLHRFVIPHPIGPGDKPGLVSDLASAWLAGGPGVLRSPATVRDLVPVDLLGLDYALYCERALAGEASAVRRPSGMIGTLLEHAEWIAASFRARWRRPCPIEARAGAASGPPRVNREPCAASHPHWSAERFWDQLAAFHHEGGGSGINQ